MSITRRFLTLVFDMLYNKNSALIRNANTITHKTRRNSIYCGLFMLLLSLIVVQCNSKDYGTEHRDDVLSLLTRCNRVANSWGR